MMSMEFQEGQPREGRLSRRQSSTSSPGSSFRRTSGLLVQAAVEVLAAAVPDEDSTRCSVIPNITPEASFTTPDVGGEIGTECLAQISVLTLNVWVNKALANVQRQCEGISGLNPDFICLQEVFSMPVLRAYQRAFPHYELVAFGRQWTRNATIAFAVGLLVPPTIYWGCLALFFSAISRPAPLLLLWCACFVFHALLFKNHYCVPFFLGNLTGLAILARKDSNRFGEFTASCVPFSHPEGQGADFLNVFRQRGFLTVKGMLQIHGRLEPLPICIATTHLNQPPEQAPFTGRHQQVQELCAALDEEQKDGGLVVLGADLNATPPGTLRGTTCSTYTDLMERFSDAWCSKHTSDPNVDGLTWDQRENPMCQSALNSLFYGTDPLRWRCDYILWNHTSPPSLPDLSVSIRSCDMVLTGDNAVSDHYGVLAVMQISGAGTSSASAAAISTNDVNAQIRAQ